MQIKVLKNHYGNYSIVANELGITPRQFRRIRNSNGNTSETTKKIIKILVKQIQALNPDRDAA